MALLVSTGTLIDGVTNIYGAPRRAWVMAFGRRDSVFVSVCLSQDGRRNHVVPVLVCGRYLRVDPVTQ